MFESNITESTRIRMLEDRCRLMDEVIALRRERDALLSSRSTAAAAAAPTARVSAVPLKKRPASYFTGGMGYSQQYVQVPPPPPPAYRAYPAHLSAAQVKTYPVVFTSLDTSRYPATPVPSAVQQSRQESGHYRRVSGDLSTQEQRQTTTSPFLPMPTLTKSRSVSPSVDDLKRPSSSVSSSSIATSSSSTMRRMPLQNRKLSTSFRLTANTVVLGKGKGPKEASGNMRLKELVQENLEEYTSSGRHGKMMVISSIIANIQAENKMVGGASFVRFQGNCWWEVTEKECRIKLSATFRDLLSDKYRSSSKSKVEQRRKQRLQKKEIADSEDAVKVLLMLKA
ncbi:MAG: hypothetical protein SGILL_004346 [Bacillariaceae sp.]